MHAFVLGTKHIHQQRVVWSGVGGLKRVREKVPKPIRRQALDDGCVGWGWS